MLINQGTAISTTRVLLVPYEKSHVPTYHEWMKDAEIQATTASEPLSLAEEYAMQASWRTDHDKLTFIACLPLPLPPSSQSASQPSTEPPSHDEAPPGITPGTQDSPDRMLGDVNLFLTPSDDDEEEEVDDHEGKGEESPLHVTGELELMIASPAHRHHGHGRAAILSLMHYIQLHLDEILQEYAAGIKSDSNSEASSASKTRRLSHLRVKIGKDNVKSIRLFESVGFVATGGGPNYFGEVELRFRLGGGRGLEGESSVRGLMGRFGVEGYEEVRYVR